MSLLTSEKSEYLSPTNQWSSPLHYTRTILNDKTTSLSFSTKRNKSSVLKLIAPSAFANVFQRPYKKQLRDRRVRLMCSLHSKHTREKERPRRSWLSGCMQLRYFAVVSCDRKVETHSKHRRATLTLIETRGHYTSQQKVQHQDSCSCVNDRHTE